VRRVKALKLSFARGFVCLTYLFSLFDVTIESIIAHSVWNMETGNISPFCGYFCFLYNEFTSNRDHIVAESILEYQPCAKIESSLVCVLLRWLKEKNSNFVTSNSVFIYLLHSVWLSGSVIIIMSNRIQLIYVTQYSFVCVTHRL